MLYKKILMIFFTYIFFISNAWAGVIIVNPKGLRWDAVVANDLAGYKIYWGNETALYPESFDIPLHTLSDPDNPDYMFDYTNMVDDKYYYVVTSYDDAGNESGYSNVVNFEINKSSPPICENLRTVDGIVIIINPGDL